MNRMEKQAIYAAAKPETPRPIRTMAIIHRATGDSAIATKAKPAAKPTTSRKLSGPRYRVERVEDTK